MEEFKFQKVLSPLNAWAFSFGCLLGWGAFVMPATVFLPIGGVWGSLPAFFIGGIFVAVIAMNYHYLANHCKGSGGIFYLLQNTMSRPHAYAASWAMCFAHMCIIPLNARALARLMRALMMEYLHVEFQLPFFNTNLMLADFIIMVLTLLFFGWINSKSIKFTGMIQTVLAIILFVGIATLFFMAVFSGVSISQKMSPAFYQGKNGILSFLGVFIMVPWAFVGFDSVPALAREVKFPKKKLGMVMIAAVVMGAFGYMANIVITLLGVPEGYATWQEYVAQAGSTTGLNSIAVVGAARRMFGRPGLIIALITLLAGILSGPNGTIAMVSRLVFAMSRSNSLFPSLGKTNDNGVPANAIKFAIGMSTLMLLLAGTFNTMETIASLCTAFGYGYCSLSAYLTARKARNFRFRITGAVGLSVCLIWFFLLLIPIPGVGNVANVTMYTCLAIWVFVGIMGYAYTCRKPDTILGE